MKQFSPIQKAIIKYLNEKSFISGRQLGDMLGVSRTAIWKQIKALQTIGLPIISEPQQGYKYDKPFIALDENELLQALSEQGFTNSAHFHLFSEIDSTNRYLKEQGHTKAMIECCIAETQSAGRGRFQRVWVSPFADNIYFSARWNLNCELSKLGGLSLVVSLAIVNYLQSLGLGEDLKIKWPNDILWRGKKLCGNLIEILTETNSLTMPVIGIGLNVNADNHSMQAVDRPWCSLREISGKYFNRNHLIAGLMIQLNHSINSFILDGFKVFKAQWQKHDYLLGQEIQVNQGNQILSGLASGVTEEGLLLLQDSNGKLQAISSGEASLHR